MMDRRGEGELAVMANARVERMDSIQMSMAKGPVLKLHAQGLLRTSSLWPVQEAAAAVDVRREQD